MPTVEQKYAHVGAVVWDAYWKEHYTVMSHNNDGSVTVQWHGDSSYGKHYDFPRRTTHRSRLDSRDRIVDMRVCLECGLPLPDDSPAFRKYHFTADCVLPGLERQDAYDRKVGR